MKTIMNTFFATIAVLTGIQANAQEMEKNLDTAYAHLDTAKTMNDLLQASALFDLAANKWPAEVMTNYYAAYSKAIVSYAETEMKKRDLILDQADVYFQKVQQLAPNSDETYVLAALLANARLAVDGNNRWKQYGGIFEANLDKAKAINANNPRIYYLKGISLFFTPKMFGGGKKKAKPYLEKANELFAVQKTGSVLLVTWGKKPNDNYLAQCNED